MTDLDSDRLREDREARDEVHSLTKIDEHRETPYHCTRCQGAWSSTMEASRTSCSATPKET